MISIIKKVRKGKRLAYISRFNFVGEPIISRKSDESFVRRFKGTKDKKADMISMRFGVRENKNNSIWVEAFGMKFDTIKTVAGDNEKIEVAWEDRFDQKIIDSVPMYRKFIAEFEDGEKQFLSKYDFIEYLAEKLPAYSGRVFVSGRYSRSFWKGELFDKFEVDTIRIATSDRNSLHLKLDLYYNKDCVDLSDFNDKKRIIVDGYIKQYINKDEGEKFVPQTVVLDVSKFNDTEKHQKYAKMLIQDIDIKNNDIVHLPWDCKIIRGVETEEFDVDMLTDRQKQQIECGIATIEDFTKPIGENIYEFRFFRQMLNGDFADGPVDSGYSLADLKNELYIADTGKVSASDVGITETQSEDMSDTTLEDLLG